MKHTLCWLTLTLTLAASGLAHASKQLSMYKDGFLTNRVPVSEIDSMRFDDASDALTLNEYQDTPKAIMDMLVSSDYFNYSSHDVFGLMAMLLATDLMGEDMLMKNSSYGWFFYDYELDNNKYNYQRTNNLWNTFMEVIRMANEVIANTPAPLLDNPGAWQGPEGAKTALGRAYAYRAYAYYYLVQLYQFTAYQDVPTNLLLPTVPLVYAPNEPFYGTREEAMPANQVLTQIEHDLLRACDLLDDSRSSKSEINQSVVYGLLARFYLLMGDWPKACESASNCLDGGYYVMPARELERGFMDVVNREWIWGYDYTNERSFAYPSYFSNISSLMPGYAGMYVAKKIDARLFNRIPSTDARKRWFQDDDNWINAADRADAFASTWQEHLANLKFGYEPNGNMDLCFMRASEMVLIQAEAYVRQGMNAEAKSALMALMEHRDPLWQATEVTLEDVLLQRRIELWGEGFVYFDLKRTNKGIDRGYEGSNHTQTSVLAVPAGDDRWVYQLPFNAFVQFPGLNRRDALPHIAPLAPESLSGTRVAFAFDVMGSSVTPGTAAGITGQTGVELSLSSDMHQDVRQMYLNKRVGNRALDTLSGFQPNTTYYARYFYFEYPQGIVYSDVVSFTTPALVVPSIHIELDSLWAAGFQVSAAYHFGEWVLPVQGMGFDLAYDEGFTQAMRRYIVEEGSVFTKAFSPVVSDTVYYVRAFVQTLDGIVYSPVLSVRTESNDQFLLASFMGTYRLSSVTIGGETETNEVALVETLFDPSSLTIKDFWYPGYDVVMVFNLIDSTVSIDNNQVIYWSEPYGDTHPVVYSPDLGVYDYDSPLTGVIHGDGSIELKAWAPKVDAGTFAIYLSTTLTKLVEDTPTKVQVRNTPDGTGRKAAMRGKTLHPLRRITPQTLE